MPERPAAGQAQPSGLEQAKAFMPTDEQQLAIGIEAPYVLVSASAGTGKSRTLVERVLHFLAAGVPLERMLIITFTRKAAGELKERLHEAFGRSERLRPLRLSLPQAHVGTIDGFCARLLRENALAAGVDPDFSVLAEPDDRLMIAEILDEIFHHWYLGRPVEQPEQGAWTGVPLRDGPGHREFLRLVEFCGMRAGREILKQELEHLLALARVHGDPDAFLTRLESGLSAPRPPFMDALAEALRAHWSAAVQTYDGMLAVALAEFAADKLKRQSAFLDVLQSAPVPWSERVTPGEPATPSAPSAPWHDLPGALEALREHLARGGALQDDRPWKIKWPSLPPGTAALLSPLNEASKSLLGAGRGGHSPFAWLPADPREIPAQYAATRETLLALLALLRQVMARYDARKREHGQLDFADLGLRAVALLRAASPELLASYEMVFVDEFQDVNTLQAEIIERLTPARGRFLVGDVKQCIYQFRLSNPAIFREHFRGAVIQRPPLAAGESPRLSGSATRGDQNPKARAFLSKNFRSRYPILAAVNGIFAHLLSPEMIGGPYADEALRFRATGHEAGPGKHLDGTVPGWDERELPAGDGWAPVEIHIFDRPAHGPAGGLPPDIVAEARFVARRIHELRAEGFRIYDGQRQAWRPLRFADIAVILRSPGSTGAGFAHVLRAAGVPVAFGGQEFFEREEIRDLLNLLTILDNAHDDIALAGVMRSPALGFSDDDLARLRLAWPQCLSLLAAVRATATGRADAWSGALARPALLAGPRGTALGHACARFLDELERWRALAQASDLAAAVTTVVDASGLLRTAGAHLDGASRIGNIEQLLGVVRRYSHERDHSLPGLIRYLAHLELSGSPLEALPEDAAADAVQILSLHKAKGLEFPVVCLSLLGRKFNERDAQNRVLTGSDWIGVDLFDPETYRQTPTVAHRMLGAMRRQAMREEELRILYVAFTRAREKLIVTGALRGAWDKAIQPALCFQEPGLRPWVPMHASAPLGWILGALATQDWLRPLDQPGRRFAPLAGLHLARHDPAVWLEAPPQDSRAEAPTAPSTPPPASDPAAHLLRLRHELPALAARLRRRYAQEPALRWRGKYWVTELKRLIDTDIHAEETTAGAVLAPSVLPTSGAPSAASMLPTSDAPPPGVSAAEEGTWWHTVLEAVDLSAADAEGVARAAAGLVAAAKIPPTWPSPGNLAPICDFFASPLGREMRASGAALEREATFSLRLDLERFAALWPGAGELGAGDWLLVQGQIDALWRRPDGIWVLLDFKSDRVAADTEIARRVELYRPQILLYREALAAIWAAGSCESWLYFLRPRRAVRVE